MSLFDFLLKRKKPDQPVVSTENLREVDIDVETWTGDNFEFLIKGDIEIPGEKFDEIMSPISFTCKKIERDNWIYYQIGNDEFSYSFEPPGIQMTFNKKITFKKAKQVGDEVVNNIRSTGQEAELVILSNGNIYKF
jgi:hypothetical protein